MHLFKSRYVDSAIIYTVQSRLLDKKKSLVGTYGSGKFHHKERGYSRDIQRFDES
jgi:hypothetical protein